MSNCQSTGNVIAGCPGQLRSFIFFAICATALVVFGNPRNAVAQSGSRAAPQQFQPAPQQFQPAPQQFQAAPQQFQQPAPQQFQLRPQSAPQSVARPEPRPEPRPSANGFGIDQVDHRPWDDLLGKYVDAAGNVDYAAWQANPADREQIRSYLRQVTSINPGVQSTRLGQFAYWINTYNALTIEGILQVFPTKSIKDHAPDPNGFNIWDDFKLTIGGQQYSLNDIEHKVLRPMGDPRIHFAINCASRGCPQLAQRAYFAQSVNRQMDDNARRFFADPQKFQYDLQRGEIRVSPIIEWFADDFGNSDAERLRTLAPFLPDANAARLAESGQARVSYLDYDWNLNVGTRSTLAPTQVTQSFRQSFDDGSRIAPAQFRGQGGHSNCPGSQ